MNPEEALNTIDRFIAAQSCPRNEHVLLGLAMASLANLVQSNRAQNTGVTITKLPQAPAPQPDVEIE